jgi:alpha-1,2-mannosyltransferase
MIFCRFGHFIGLRGSKNSDKEKIIGFFHPSCDAGAGGEKVLWQAIKCLTEAEFKGQEIKVVIYSLSKMNLDEIIKQKVE